MELFERKFRTLFVLTYQEKSCYLYKNCRAITIAIDGLHTIITRDKHARDKLLMIIRCNCKNEWKTLGILVWKPDLPCTATCGPYQVDGSNSDVELVNDIYVDNNSYIDLYM